MTEPGPVSFSLVGAAVALAGPVLGPYALVVFAAGVGAGLALSVEKPPTRWAAFRFWLLATAIALLLTGPACWIVDHYTDVPSNIALIPVAFVLGAARTHIGSFINQALDAIAAAVGAALQAAANRRGGGQ
jgi:Na+/melibiose symporter-like transporter